jgi:hypothetical protein
MSSTRKLRSLFAGALLCGGLAAGAVGLSAGTAQAQPAIGPGVIAPAPQWWGPPPPPPPHWGWDGGWGRGYWGGGPGYWGGGPYWNTGWGNWWGHPC